MGLRCGLLVESIRRYIQRRRDDLLDELTTYCEEIRAAVADPNHAGEQSLYPALHKLLSVALPRLAERDDIRVIHQARADVGAPDFQISAADRPPLGFVEAKAPDNDLRHKTGHDKEQHERYTDLPNWVYCNFWEFYLYQHGELVARAVLVPRSALDPETDLAEELRDHDAAPGYEVLSQFVQAQPPLISDASDAARWLARSARLVRGAVRQALLLPPKDVAPLIDVRDEFREVLFAGMEDADRFDEAFSDSYAQTLAYGLLVGRISSGGTLSLSTAHQQIDEAQHPLLKATVRLLAEDEVVALVGWTLEVLVDVINSIDPGLLEDSQDRDPILYFYEDFLAEYDPAMRKRRGVYFTPPSVVRYQVRTIHKLLKDKFQLAGGLLNERVLVLDPAAGTGTYLVTCLEEAAREAESQWGPGSVAAAVKEMLPRLFGLELLVGPYTVAHYRLRSAAMALGVTPESRLSIYLTDTLSRPEDTTEHTPKFAYLSLPLTNERAAADEVKSHKPILVVLGNPPYERTTASRNDWLYEELLDDFRKPVRDAKLAVHLKSLSDPYVYFYRWALWRLFEAKGAIGTGILSFITNRSWLRGEAFGGLRQTVRERFDEGWIFDLHGDSKAALPAGIHTDENVFDIRAGVAVGVFIKASEAEGDAKIKYVDIFGRREDKEAALEAGFDALDWKEISGTEIEPLLPSMAAEFESWPNLKKVFPYSKSGVKTERDALVIDTDRGRLLERLGKFFSLSLNAQVEPFHESGGRTVGRIRRRAFVEDFVQRISYRFLDRRYLYNDPDFVSRPGPEMQQVWGAENMGLYAMPANTGYGQAAVLVTELPDYHTFRGSYGGYVFPLFDRRGGEEHFNIAPRLLDSLHHEWDGHAVSPIDIFAFVYAILACGQYSLQFSSEINRSFPHVPIPKDAAVFELGVKLGRKLLELHSLEKPSPESALAKAYGDFGTVVKCRLENGQLRICDELYVEPVSEEAWGYSVSGYDVLRRWVDAREGQDLTLSLLQELLQIVHVLEETVAMQPALSDFLETVLDGSVFSSEELGLG